MYIKFVTEYTVQWNTDFLNPGFLKNPANQKLFPLDL